MKCLKALLLAPLVLGACEKSNNVAQLHAQANAVTKTYAPIAAELGKRMDSIHARGKNVPGNLPDVPELVRLITEAGDKINEMKGITAAIDKQADDAAKANKPDELEKLIDESHEKLDLDATVANEDLTRIEGWLWQFEQGRMSQPAAPVPLPPVAPTEAPEPTNPPAGGGSAAAAPADKADKADKAKSDKTEKAAQKAATEKADKKAAPADKADKKAAAPKAGAGSAAK
jgi:hypothetical protein